MTHDTNQVMHHDCRNAIAIAAHNKYRIEHVVDLFYFIVDGKRIIMRVV